MRLCGGVVQVKQGAENMISMYSAMKDKKMCAESQQMLSDAKHKVEYIRMQLLRLEQQKETTSLNNSENNDEQNGHKNFLLPATNIGSICANSFA